TEGSPQQEAELEDFFGLPYFSDSLWMQVETQHRPTRSLSASCTGSRFEDDNPTRDTGLNSFSVEHDYADTLASFRSGASCDSCQRASLCRCVGLDQSSQARCREVDSIGPRRAAGAQRAVVVLVSIPRAASAASARASVGA